MKKPYIVLAALLMTAVLSFTSLYCCADVLRVGRSEELTDLASLTRFTGRDYTDAEIVDIQTVLVQDVSGTGTVLFVFLREAGPFEGKRDYDGYSLDMYGPYFYEILRSVGVEREDLISCGTHFRGIEFHAWYDHWSTTQYVDWMPLRESFGGYSNVLIQTYIPGSTVTIQDKDALLGKH